MRGVVGVVAIGLVLTGCSSGSTTQPASTARSKPTTPAGQLLPTAADFPTGATLQQLPPDRFAKSQNELDATMRSAKIDPPQCGGKRRDITEAMSALQPKTSAVAAFDTTGTLTYVVAIIDQGVDLEMLEAGVLGPCGDLTVSLTAGATAAIETSYSTSVPLPADLRADNAVAYQTTTSVSMPSAPGSTHTTTVLTGYAVLRGLTVEAKLSSLDTESHVAEFGKLFTIAVDKVRNAS